MHNLLISLVIIFGCTNTAFGQSITMIIQSPDRIKIQEKFTYDLYIKNESSDSLIIPKYILGGPGTSFSHKLFDQTGKEIPIKFVPEYSFSPSVMTNATADLVPWGIYGMCDALPTKLFFPSCGRYRIQFIWEGCLWTSASERVFKKFIVDKWIIIE